MVARVPRAAVFQSNADHPLTVKLNKGGAFCILVLQKAGVTGDVYAGVGALTAAAAAFLIR